MNNIFPKTIYHENGKMYVICDWCGEKAEMSIWSLKLMEYKIRNQPTMAWTAICPICNIKYSIR